MRVVTAAVIFVASRLLICQRPTGDSLAGLWELPGGKVEPDETPEDCLARELVEELGIRSEVGPLFGISVHEYERGAIELRAFRVRWHGEAIEARFHSAIRFASLEEIGSFSFAPADIPLIERLRKEWWTHARE